MTTSSMCAAARERSRSPLTWLALVTLCIYLGWGIVNPVLPLFAQDFGVGTAFGWFRRYTKIAIPTATTTMAPNSRAHFRRLGACFSVFTGVSFMAALVASADTVGASPDA